MIENVQRTKSEEPGREALATPQWNRRQALHVVAGATALAMGGSALTQAAEAKPDFSKHPYIDAHSHIWTRDVKSYPLAPNRTVDDLDPPSFTAAELLATCRPVKVGRVVLIGHTIFYADDNTYMVDAAKEHPGVFRIVAIVNDLKDGVEAKMRKLAKEHVSGYRIVSSRRPDDWLQGPGIETMWKLGPQLGQAICPLMEADHLDALDAMCRRFPDTTVVIDHFARIGIDGQIREKDVTKLCSLAKRKKVHVKLSAYYALGKKKPPYDYLTPMIRRLLDAYGPERLMWASDAPYQMTNGNTYEASIQFVQEGLDFLSKTDRDHLLRGTAERVFYGTLG